MKPEDRDWIMNASLEQLLRKWRFAPLGDPWFQDQERGKLHETRMGELRAANYWANQAQYRSARIIAERALIKALYEDELRYLDEAVHAMYNRDMDLAVALLSKLRLSITGDRD